jgi:hypothetical protein
MGYYDRINALLERFEADLERVLAKFSREDSNIALRAIIALADEKNPLRRLRTLRTLPKLLKALQHEYFDYGDQMRAMIGEMAREGAKLHLGEVSAAPDAGWPNYLNEIKAVQQARFAAYWEKEDLSHRAEITRLVQDALGRGMPAPQLGRLLREATGSSRTRAQLIARNELAAAYSHATALAAGYMQDALGMRLNQRWVATRDARTRSSHAALEGQVRPLGADFTPGLAYPHDPRAPSAETIRCRCVVLLEENAVQDA